jgi:hypothetical protein
MLYLNDLLKLYGDNTEKVHIVCGNDKRDVFFGDIKDAKNIGTDYAVTGIAQDLYANTPIQVISVSNVIRTIDA